MSSPVDIAAGAAKRDTRRLRRGHNTPGPQLVRPTRSSRTPRQSAHNEDTGKLSAGVKSRKVATSSKDFLIPAACSLDTAFLDPTPSRRITRAFSKSVQAQLTPSLDTPAADPLPTQSVQPASTATGSPTAPPQPTRTKHKHESIEEEPVRRRRERSQSVAELPPSKDLLTWQNLEKLNIETASKTSDGMAGTKRSHSLRESTAELKPETASMSLPRSSLTLANYRLMSLDRARIVVQHRGIPEHLMHRVNAIIQPKLDKDQESLVFYVADNLCKQFPNVLEDAAREDDCVELLYQALNLMNGMLYDEAFALPRKADWDPALKPKAQRMFYMSNPPNQSLNDTGDSHDRPHKRQRVGASYVSSKISDATMMPLPPRPSKPDNNYVKTARPDITIGFFHHVVTKKLLSLGVNELAAKELLKDLQYQGELMSSPTRPALHVRFPSLVVEGKAYATGKSMYEAENQAAGSGSSMLAMQGHLAELTERYSPGSYENKEPLAFSVTHEGPLMLLWVHYITSLEDARFYNMHALGVCHTTMQSNTREFFMALAGVMRWASTEFLDDVAAQLFLVWKAANGQTT